MQFIESRDNLKYKQASRWVRQPRVLKKSGMAVVESLHSLEELLNWPGLVLKQVWVGQSLLNHAQWHGIQNQLSLQSHCELMVVSDALYWQLSELSSGVGPLSFFECPGIEAQDERNTLPEQVCDVLILDCVQDPGNVGTLIRTAAAAGIQEVWVTEGTAWPWSSKVLRAGMGGHRLVNIHGVTPEQLPAWFKDMTVIVTALSAPTRLYDCRLTVPVAWIMGSEGAGVSAVWQNLATHTVFIPQRGAIESLNVGVACGICLFEQLRQRLV